MRRPTTSNTTVFPSLENVTPEQHAVILKAATNVNDPHRFRTSILVARAFCAIRLCDKIDGPFAVMILELQYPKDYFSADSYRLAAEAVGAVSIVQGPRWAVLPAEAVERAATSGTPCPRRARTSPSRTTRAARPKTSRGTSARTARRYGRSDVTNEELYSRLHESAIRYDHKRYGLPQDDSKPFGYGVTIRHIEQFAIELHAKCCQALRDELATAQADREEAAKLLRRGRFPISNADAVEAFIKNNATETTMSSGGTHPTMREQIDALEATLAETRDMLSLHSKSLNLANIQLAAAHAAMRRISANAGMPFAAGNLSVTTEEYEAKISYGIGRFRELGEKMREQFERRIRELNAALDTANEARQAAESSIAAIPAICRGEPVPCALHVSAPITEMRTNKDAAYASLEAVHIETERDLLAARRQVSDLVRVSGMTDVRVVRDRNRAVDTLTRAGYTDCGGQLWKPPLGKPPNFDRIDRLQETINEAVRLVNIGLLFHLLHGDPFDGDCWDAVQAMRAFIVANSEEPTDKKHHERIET